MRRRIWREVEVVVLAYETERAYGVNVIQEHEEGSRQARSKYLGSDHEPHF